MLGSSTFELVLGMVFIFLLLSLVVSTVREAMEARLKTRARHLARGIAQLLGSDQRAREFMEFPLVRALYDGGGKRMPATFKDFTGASFVGSLFVLPWRVVSKVDLPSYIPKRTFALALMQLARDPKFLNADDPAPQSAKGFFGHLKGLMPAKAPERKRTTAPAPPAVGAPEPALMAEIKDVLRAHPQSELSMSLQAVLALAKDDVEKAVTGLEQWYDGTMDRVSGWYKRETQHILFWLGLVVAIGMNVDSIFLVKYLNTDAAARNRLALMAVDFYDNNASRQLALAQVNKDRVAAGLPALPEPGVAAPAAGASNATRSEVERADQSVREAMKRLTDLNLPIGWTQARWDAMTGVDTWLRSMVGWLVTAFAVSFGAPFWFDLFSKIMVVRSTVKPSEKGPAKAADDSQGKGTGK
jgi:hypothetical protein